MNPDHSFELDNNAAGNPKNPQSLQQRKKQKKIKILYEEYLPGEYSGPNLPYELAQKRNWMIKALYFQLLATIAGFGFFFIRRFRLYLIFNSLSLIFIYLGFKGALSLNKWGIAAHSVFTTSILGMVWLYFILEALFYKRMGESSSDIHLSERMTMFLLALPYLVDLICGIISFSLTYNVFKLEDTKTKLSQKFQELEEEVDVNENYDPNSEVCCVCVNFKKSSVIYPCGHLALCNYCSRDFKVRKVKNCPLCRKEIKDIINVYT